MKDATDDPATVARILAYLRHDDGRYLEKYMERRRAADEIERGDHLRLLLTNGDK